MKLENGQNLQDFLKVFVELFEELAIIGDAMEEEERVIILLSSLPDRFSTLVTALEANEKIPAWEVVTERLLNEERRQRGSSGTSDSSEKLLVSFKRNKKLIKCFECGKEGYIKRQCRVYEERLRKENRTLQANKSVDARSSSAGETIMFTSAFPIDNVDCDSWIVDSGATQHMYNKKNQFSSYSDLSSPVRIEIGDGRALKGIGVGDVRLKITLLNMQVKNCFVKNVLSGTKGYMLCDFNAKRILLSRDVVYNESQFMSFEKEPSKEIECVPWSFPQEEKHEDSEGEFELRRSTRNRTAPVDLENGCALHKLNLMFLERSAYTKALLSRFGMDKANSVATPVDINADLVTTSDEVEDCDKKLKPKCCR
ncbi:Zinc finger CCHC-type [Trinorchestia longiramus]|nr:Zinc finger CCHC-type [Trinorchestia longiramus]